jgi:hypothetical protein
MSAPDAIRSRSSSFPTVLVAVCANGLAKPLTLDLLSQGYFVLEARNEVDALEVVKIHSRPIHLMLADGNPQGRALAATVKQYRRQISIVFVAGHAQAGDGDLFSPNQAVMRVRELVSPPGVAAKTERAPGKTRHASGGYL